MTATETIKVTRFLVTPSYETTLFLFLTEVHCMVEMEGMVLDPDSRAPHTDLGRL